MSLAIPRNVASRGDLAGMCRTILAAIPGPVTYHVFDGQFAPHSIDANELDGVTSRIANCSIVYVLDGIRGPREPIAGFVANESLGIAKLQYLIDGPPPGSNMRIPRRTIEMLGIYIRSLFAETHWVNTVMVPTNVDLLDGLFQLTVESDGHSRVTLKDTGHRPQSARKWS